MTPTHAPRSGSIAIDSGNHGLCPAVDQRDWLRWDPGCDIGSLEVSAIEFLIFADGFESGDTDTWSGHVPDGPHP